MPNDSQREARDAFLAKHSTETFLCECGETITVLYDRQTLTYRHGDGEALLELPPDDGDDDDDLPDIAPMIEAWKSRIHAYEVVR